MSENYFLSTPQTTLDDITFSSESSLQLVFKDYCRLLCSTCFVGFFFQSLRKKIGKCERKELPESYLEHAHLQLFKMGCKCIHAEHRVYERHSMDLS